jgi:glycosyltransferase involved in cell wall biosynthesis
MLADYCASLPRGNMKILYFHQHFSTPQGSGGTRSYEMAQRLISGGHEVIMVCGSYSNGKTGLESEFQNGRREGMVAGIHVIEFNLAYGNKDGLIKRSMTFLKFAMRSVGVALTAPADIVFATTTPLTAGIPGIAAKWLRSKPFVFEVRDLWPELPRQMGVITNPLVLSAMGALEWASYKSADRLIGLSPGIVEGIARHVPDRSKIAMIPNGCDLDLFGGDVEPWRPAGVAADDFMAIFTGTHGKANGLGAVIDAAAVLKQRGVSGIKLVLGDGAEKAMLMARVQAEALQDIVIFHDPVPKTKLTGLMASADLGLQILANIPAFYYGTSPNKFFDYLSAGLPVLTNYPGWVAELVAEHDCGVAVLPDDPAAFADALLEMNNGGRLAAYRTNARTLANAEFSRDSLAKLFVAQVAR